MFSIKKRCNYQNDVLKKAIAEVKDGKRTVSDAARYYQIPRTTLGDKVRGIHSGQYGKNTKLNADEETALVEYIKYMDKIGHPLGVLSYEEPDRPLERHIPLPQAPLLTLVLLSDD